jgi:hypothetical protein
MIETALPFLNNLDKETDFVVWNAVVKALRQTFWLFSGTSGLNGFRVRIRIKIWHIPNCIAF